MDGPRQEQTFVARATTYGGWFGLVVGATVGFQTGENNLAGVVGAALGFVAGRIIVRGIAVASWCLLSHQSADQVADYDEARPS